MIPNSEKKSTTVRISKKDLLKLLSENEELKAKFSSLEEKYDAALDMLAEYKLAMQEMDKEVNDINCITDPSVPAEESHIYNPNIYFDGSQGLP